MKLTRLLTRGTILISILLVLAIIPVSYVLADTAGANFPTTGSNDPGTGTAVWQNPGNITAADENYATVTIEKGNHISNYLRGTGYNFSLPPKVTITGIEVAVRRMASSTTPPPVNDNAVYLLKDGTRVGIPKTYATSWPDTFQVATYGGPGDLWGTTWNATEVGTIGVDLSVKAGNNSDVRLASVDYMTVKVYYSPSVTTTVDCGNGTPIGTYGDNITCVATVTGSGSLTPTGTVGWTTNSSGSFSNLASCTLQEVSTGIASCQIDYTPSVIGDHVITANYSGDLDHDLSSGNETVSVNARPVTVIADPQSKIYGNSDPGFDYQISLGTLVPGDNFAGALSRDAGEDVGTYTITQGTLTLGSNYNLTYVPADLTITKRPITVTAEAKTKVVGQSDPTLTYTVTGNLAFSDTFTGALTRVAGELVGHYAIQQGTLSLNANYDLTYVGAELVITNASYYLPIVVK
jgi:MBG domain (YGX type)